MSLALEGDHRLTGDGGAWADSYQMKGAVAGSAAVAEGPLLQIGYEDRGNEMRAGKEWSALRRNRELPAAVEVALLYVR